MTAVLLHEKILSRSVRSLAVKNDDFMTNVMPDCD
jgi:hypothetical protein